MSNPSVRISAFGAIAATVSGQPAALGPLKQRMLLAVLLCRAGVEVASEELIEALWGDVAPASAANNLRSYVYGLRRALGDDLITGNGRPGYRLHTDRLSSDLADFHVRCAQGEAALAGGDPATARDALVAAVALRRDRAFADVSHLPAIADEVRGLEERWLLAVQQRFEAELNLGRAGELVGELATLAAHHPYRERFCEQLMLALYRAGRQSEALAAYQNARRVLRDDLGIEPGPALQAVQQRILAGDTALMGRPTQPGTSAVRPAQLPLDIAGFASRDAELAQLDAAIERRPTAVAISAVSGTAGVGKTALAVHWAHRVRDQFPDGQCYVNLRGFDPDGTGLSPEEAIRELLAALDVEPQRIPAGLAAQSALYRSTLAGRRMLIVLDNARDDDQVRPLLPGAPGCLVLVTSRNQLSGLVATQGAYPLILDLLDLPGARQLITERLGDDRVRAEPDAVDDIIERCARLPLALAVVAARAVTHPGFSLRSLADELTQVRTALDAFDGPDPASDVRSVFSWSYQSLSTPAARLFRLLGLHPGPHVGTPAVASLAGVPVGAVRPLLAELTHAHLLNEYRPGRYTFHDLLRAYATELAEAIDDAEERTSAIHRILDHYLHTAHRAALLLTPHRDPLTLDPVQLGVTPEHLTDGTGALTWFITEDPVLIGVMAQAEQAGFDSHVWRISWACSEFFARQGKWQVQVSTHVAARAATKRSEDRVGAASALRGLGLGYSRLGRYDEASTHLQAALALSRELGDLVGQARTLNNAGWVLAEQRRYPEAIAHSHQAFELYRAADHQRGQADALNNIGWYHAQNGAYAQAVAPCQQAIAIYSAIGNRLGQAAALDSAALAHRHLGDHRRAIASYREALDLLRESGNRYQETQTLTNLGDTYRAVGDDESAHRVWRQALATLDELGHPDAAQVRAKIDTAPGRTADLAANTDPS